MSLGAFLWCFLKLDTINHHRFEYITFCHSFKKENMRLEWHEVRKSWQNDCVNCPFHDCRAVVTVCCAFLRGDEGGGDVLISPLPSVTRASLSLSLSLPPPRVSPLIFSLELRVRDKDPRPFCTRSHRQRSSACRIQFFSQYYACVPDCFILTCLCVEVYFTDTTAYSWWTKIPRL